MYNGEVFYVSQKYYPATVVVERPWVAVVDEFTVWPPGEPVETVDEWVVGPPAAVDEWPVEPSAAVDEWAVEPSAAVEECAVEPSAAVDEWDEPTDAVDEWDEPTATVDEWDEPADAVWAETDDRGNSVGGGGGCEGYTSGAVDSEAENQHQVHKHGQSKNARKVCQST